MRISPEFLAELRYRNRIDEVVSGYVNLKRSGSTLKGLCPFHNEKTPSFTVYPENGSYYCFGCQNGGDVITFIRNAENLDYIEAVKWLADRSGLQMPQEGYDDSAERLRRTIYEINREAARYFHQCLLSEAGRAGLAYLKQRQLHMQTIRHFGLGFAPNSWTGLCDYLKTKGFREADMVLANVAGKGRNGGVYDRFRNKVMFPIIDLRGNVIAFGGRKLPGEDGAKYINTNDTPVYKKSKNLYALNFAKNAKSDALILCEGYMDVIALHQAGFTNAIAALGTSFTEDQAMLISRYAKELILTLDADEAGQRATARAIGILNKTGLQIRVLQVPDGKDPDEFIKSHGAEQFKMLLEGAKNDIEFRLLKIKNSCDMATDAGKLQYLDEGVKMLAGVDDEIAVNLYAGRIAQECGVDKQVLLLRIREHKRKIQGASRRRQLREAVSRPQFNDQVNPQERKFKRAAAAEQTIIAVLMLNAELLQQVKQQLSPEDFVTPFYSRVYDAVVQVLESGRPFDLTALSGQFAPEEMGRIVLLQNKSQVYQNAAAELQDCINVLKSEKAKMTFIQPEQMDDAQWAAAMQDIGKQKKNRGAV